MPDGRYDPIEPEPNDPTKCLKLRCWLEKVRVAVHFRKGLVEAEVILPSELIPESLFDLIIVQPLRHLLLYREWLTIHASVVAKGTDGIIITGPSGAGKSALALSLARLGYQILADDLAIFLEYKDSRAIHLLPFPKKTNNNLFLNKSLPNSQVPITPKQQYVKSIQCIPCLILIPHYQKHGRINIKPLTREATLSHIIGDPANRLYYNSLFSKIPPTRHEIVLTRLMQQVDSYLVDYNDKALRKIVPGMIEPLLARVSNAIRVKPDFVRQGGSASGMTEAHFNRGFAYNNSGDYQKAIESFKEAIRLKPDDVYVHFNLGLAYNNSGDYQKAIESFKEAIRLKPDDVYAHYNLGLAYSNSGDYQKAIESFKEAIRLKPDDVYAHYNLGLAYSNSGDYQKAIESFKEAIHVKPDFVGAHYNLGLAYSNSENYQKAIESFKEAIRLKPDDFYAHFNLGLAYNNSGDYQKAIESFKEAIRLKPDDFYAHFNLGLAYNNSGDYQKAIESFKEAIRLKPDDVYAHYNLGLAYSNSGDYQKAIESFKKAIRLKPDDFYAHFNLGLAYSNSEDYQKAIESFKEAIRLKPDDFYAHFNLGLAYLGMRDYQKAVELLKKATKINPNGKEIWYYYACALSGNQNIDEAFQSLKKAIELGDKNFDCMKKDTKLENLRQDKRFRELVH